MASDHVPWCEACRKRAYSSEEKASYIAASLPPTGHRPTHAYPCPCRPGRWHVGHAPTTPKRAADRDSRCTG